MAGIYLEDPAQQQFGAVQMAPIQTQFIAPQQQFIAPQQQTQFIIGSQQQQQPTSQVGSAGTLGGSDPTHNGNQQQLNRTRFGNPAPLGLFAFALTLFVWSLHNVGASVNTASRQGVVLGLALFYGGIVQFAAGMWELQVGNTLGATILTGFGGFWTSYGVIYLPPFGFNISIDTTTVNRDLGIFYFAWMVFTWLVALASHRTSITLQIILWTTGFHFLCISVGNWGSVITLIQAGGAFGLLAAAAAWYLALAGLLTPENSVFLLPIGDLSRRRTLASAGKF